MTYRNPTTITRQEAREQEISENLAFRNSLVDHLERKEAEISNHYFFAICDLMEITTAQFGDDWGYDEMETIAITMTFDPEQNPNDDPDYPDYLRYFSSFTMEMNEVEETGDNNLYSFANNIEI